MEILISVFVLATAVIMLFVAGLPLSWLLLGLGKNKKSRAYVWYLAPFTGFSLIAIILKTLVGLNIPLKFTAIPLAAVILLIFAVFLWKKYTAIPRPSMLLIAGFGVVLTVSSIGYIIVGAGNYMGYNWWDNIFYVTQTQFHIDFPLHTAFDSFKNQPWMAYAILSPEHRISRSVVQGFIAVICGVKAEYTVGFISILSSLLTYCAVCFAAHKIKMNKYAKAGACVFAATVPGLISLQLEGFLGAALIVPFLIVICPLLCSVFERAKIGNCILCAMILATAITIYTEATTVFLLLGLVIFIWSVCIGKVKISKFYVPILIIGMSVLIDIQFIGGIYSTIATYAAPSQALDSIYSFAQGGPGFSFAYLGFTNKYFGLLAILVEIMGFLGLVFKFLDTKSPMLLAFIALTLSPIMFISGSNLFLYNYFRLILIASPLIMFGLWLFCIKIHDLIRASRMKATVFKWDIKNILEKAVVICLLGVSSISLAGSFMAVIRTIDQHSSRANPKSVDAVALQHRLNLMEGKNIFLVSQLNLESW